MFDEEDPEPENYEDFKKELAEIEDFYIRSQDWPPLPHGVRYAPPLIPNTVWRKRRFDRQSGAPKRRP